MKERQKRLLSLLQYGRTGAGSFSGGNIEEWSPEQWRELTFEAGRHALGCCNRTEHGYPQGKGCRQQMDRRGRAIYSAILCKPGLQGSQDHSQVLLTIPRLPRKTIYAPRCDLGLTQGDIKYSIGSNKCTK